MAVRTKAQIKADISSKLADNTSEDIDAVDVRSVVTDITDSMALESDLTGAGLSQAEVDARVSAGVKDFAETGGPVVPEAEIDAAIARDSEVTTAVSDHNTSSTAHADIRAAITAGTGTPGPPGPRGPSGLYSETALHSATSRNGGTAYRGGMSTAILPDQLLIINYDNGNSSSEYLITTNEWLSKGTISATSGASATSSIRIKLGDVGEAGYTGEVTFHIWRGENDSTIYYRADGLTSYNVSFKMVQGLARPAGGSGSGATQMISFATTNPDDSEGDDGDLHISIHDNRTTNNIQMQVWQKIDGSWDQQGAHNVFSRAAVTAALDNILMAGDKLNLAAQGDGTIDLTTTALDEAEVDARIVTEGLQLGGGVPESPGTASSGRATVAAREDHVHPPTRVIAGSGIEVASSGDAHTVSVDSRAYLTSSQVIAAINSAVAALEPGMTTEQEHRLTVVEEETADLSLHSHTSWAANTVANTAAFAVTTSTLGSVAAITGLTYGTSQTLTGAGSHQIIVRLPNATDPNKARIRRARSGSGDRLFAGGLVPQASTGGFTYYLVTRGRQTGFSFRVGDVFTIEVATIDYTTTYGGGLDVDRILERLDAGSNITITKVGDQIQVTATSTIGSTDTAARARLDIIEAPGWADSTTIATGAVNTPELAARSVTEAKLDLGVVSQLYSNLNRIELGTATAASFGIGGAGTGGFPANARDALPRLVSGTYLFDYRDVHELQIVFTASGAKTVTLADLNQIAPAGARDAVEGTVFYISNLASSGDITFAGGGIADIRPSAAEGGAVVKPGYSAFVTFSPHGTNRYSLAVNAWIPAPTPPIQAASNTPISGISVHNSVTSGSFTPPDGAIGVVVTYLNAESFVPLSYMRRNTSAQSHRPDPSAGTFTFGYQWTGSVFAFRRSSSSIDVYWV